jgi:hypothetical protein
LKKGTLLFREKLVICILVAAIKEHQPLIVILNLFASGLKYLTKRKVYVNQIKLASERNLFPLAEVMIVPTQGL